MKTELKKIKSAKDPKVRLVIKSKDLNNRTKKIRKALPGSTPKNVRVGNYV